jgi:hypothetical protein
MLQSVASILGVGGRDPQILKWGSWRWVVGVVEGVVSGLLRNKGEGREPTTPSFQTILTPLAAMMIRFQMFIH